MIRINLLPVKATKRREQGVRQLIVGVVSVSIALVAIIIFHGTQVSQVNQMRADNQATSRAIAALKAEIGDYEVVKAQRDELSRQRDAIKRLQQNRSGPVWLMRELSDILTKGKGPTFNKERYEEHQHSVKIHGAAKSDEDVAEFLKRLKLSAFFDQVYWQQTQPQVDNKYNVNYVTFDVTCRVNY